MPRQRHDAQNREIGIRIRLARLRAGMQQTELGARLGVSYQQINKYEWGKSAPTGLGLRDLATSLGVTVDWLLGEGDAADMPKKLDSVRLEAQILAAFAALGNDRLRLIALDFVETLAASRTADAPSGTDADTNAPKHEN